jgi:septal ring factor EnvC (AmiA/AmiB activator)
MVVIPLLTLLLAGHATALEMRASAAANPIRKVVTMLQMMQNKVTEEGKKKEALFDKYMCYCQNADETLGKSIADAEAKIPQLEAEIKEAAALKEQLEADLEKAKSDRADAKEALAKAKALREKEAAAFAAETGELKSNIDALSKAIPAIEKGMAGFLQTRAASVLRRLSVSMDMSSQDREMLASFLSEDNSASYVPQSGEIVGILKQMKDEMEKDLADLSSQEAAAQADYEALVAAKTKEIEANTKAIEEKTERVGNIAVEVATKANDLEDTKEGLEEDKKFLADLEKNCELKKAEWAEYRKMQSMELIALADTIKVLNDDDALELFKKTLPSAASSFLQIQRQASMSRRTALSMLQTAHTKGRSSDPRLDLLEVALRGGKMGFEKIVKMIDDLVVLLKKEQADDDAKKEYCLAEMDKAEDTIKELNLDKSDLEKAIADGEESVATLASEIKALTAGIKALDKDVAEQTEQRKEEHEDFVESVAANTAALDVLEFAKNRLNKFYNPALYKAPPKRELSEEERITVNMGGTLAPTAPPAGIAGTGIGLAQESDAPPPPPEADLAYKKKGEESNGVIAMIDLLKSDLEKENLELEMTEKNSQEDYEKFMADAAAKRAEDSKSITDKEASKAQIQEEIEANTEALKAKKVELMETGQYLNGLHAECDWLLQYFDLRKEARTNEINALGKAKDVLQGADYE